MTTLDVKLTLSDEVLATLRIEAIDRDIPLDSVVSEVLEEYFNEPTEAEILDSLKIGMQQARAGNYRPAHEVLDEIEHETRDDGVYTE